MDFTGLKMDRLLCIINNITSLKEIKTVFECKNGYEIQGNYEIPERCRFQGKYDYANCKSCPYYNHEYALINQAIESAKCRIYKLKDHDHYSIAHQKKAENQRELMNVTIKALEYYRDNHK